MGHKWKMSPPPTHTHTHSRIWRSHQKSSIAPSIQVYVLSLSHPLPHHLAPTTILGPFVVCRKILHTCVYTQDVMSYVCVWVAKFNSNHKDTHMRTQMKIAVCVSLGKVSKFVRWQTDWRPYTPWENRI